MADKTGKFHMMVKEGVHSMASDVASVYEQRAADIEAQCAVFWALQAVAFGYDSVEQLAGHKAFVGKCTVDLMQHLQYGRKKLLSNEMSWTFEQ